jgi:DNA-binding HxlR family transcriptional regulator
MKYKRKAPPSFHCDTDLIAEVFYGKWKIALLYQIHEGNRRPSELQRKIPAASRRVLNMQLNKLERHELIEKKIYAEVPPRVEYFLTDFGKSAIPLLLAMGDWADQQSDKLRTVVEREYNDQSESIEL